MLIKGVGKAEKGGFEAQVSLWPHLIHTIFLKYNEYCHFEQSVRPANAKAFMYVKKEAASLKVPSQNRQKLFPMVQRYLILPITNFFYKKIRVAWYF